jgi:drug/metabolite transporter (DMT)-like permease
VASAGYLYLGQTIVLGIWWLMARAAGRAAKPRSAARTSGPLLAGTIAGGLIAPVAFTSGLALIPAHRASLLLGIEIVFTLLIAIGFRGERLSARGWMGAAMLLAGRRPDLLAFRVGGPGRRGGSAGRVHRGLGRPFPSVSPPPASS